MNAFQEAYKKLNPQQKMAVDTIDGPVMVIAGPGTGKTQILTLRIANILQKTDTAPENILALTFTEAATANMRKRLVGLIGNPGYRVAINTFHGFCNDVIKKYPEDFPRIIGSTSITNPEQIQIIETILDTLSGTLELLRPFGDPLLYVRDIVSAIADLKREGVSANQFSELVTQEEQDFLAIPDLYYDTGAHKGKMKGKYKDLEKKIKKNQELAHIYTRYQEMLFEQKKYDFSDMIMEVLYALQKNESLLQMLQEEFQYVLVDEHQDTNNAQNKILELLMSHFAELPNLFVVGDEKQAIFRFQGASLENFLYFKKIYPRAQLITLTQNYRSTQSILDHAHSVIPAPHTLQANTEYANRPIHTIALDNKETECYFVAHDIKQKISHGYAPHEIAIVYRNNRDAFPMARALEKLHIPYTIESDQDLFSQPDVRTMLVILRAVNDYGNNVLLGELLHISLFNLDPLNVYKLIRTAHDTEQGLYDTMLDDEYFSDISHKLKKWTSLARQESLITVFETLLHESGLLHHCLTCSEQSTIPDRMHAIHGLFDIVKEIQESKPDATIKDFFVYLDIVQKHKIFLKRKANLKNTGVRLMTVHKSKGLEFGYVYIIHANDKIFGGNSDRNKLPLIDSVYRLDK